MLPVPKNVRKGGLTQRRGADLGAASARLGAAWSRPERSEKAADQKVVEPAIDASLSRSEATGGFLGTGQTSGDGWKAVLLTKRRFQSRARRRRRRSGGDDLAEEGAKLKTKGQKS